MHEVSRRATDRMVRHAEGAHDSDCLHLRPKRRRTRQLIDLIETRQDTQRCIVGSVGFECDIQHWNLVGWGMSDVVYYEQILAAILGLVDDFVVHFDYLAFTPVRVRSFGPRIVDSSCNA